MPAAPPAWAWASQPQPTQTVETEPLEYHRLLRGAQGYKWWKPLLVVLIAAGIYIVLSIIISVIWFAIMAVGNPDLFTSSDATAMSQTLVDQLALDTQNPLSVFMNLLTIALMIPSVILAMLVMGMRPVGRVWSVATRIRWGALGRFTGIAVLGVVVMNVTGTLLEMLFSLAVPVEAVAPAVSKDFDGNAALLSFVFVLILVPIQATAEEVVFRGLFMQVLGSWLKNPWFAILIPTVAFAGAHIYDMWGLAAVGFMGLTAAWLTWRTGGLEAAIAIHVINNIAAFGVMASGIGGSTAQTESAGGPGSLIGEVIGLSLFTWLVVRSFKKRGYGRTRIDLLRVPVAPLQAQPLQ
ncbi:CPBP family intramembrane metalloprotease [Leucobacter viscericola]|uniref:CPBP family intramembrane metalloprotease n=2 Tax=Leucobacter viscericola TaxID=2714935 RepID=A0A6G7XK87_9MICO|nr:CPBP family intramembrane metalloprotease [Leucobacter viscericola]